MADNGRKRSSRKTSRQLVGRTTELDDDADESTNRSTQEPQQPAKRQKRNVVVKNEPSQQMRQNVVLLEADDESVAAQNGISSSAIVPDHQPSSSVIAPSQRKGLLKIGDDEDIDDDDDVMVVEPPVEDLSPFADGDTNEEIQIMGCKNQTRLPHLRQHCTEKKFVILPNFSSTCEARYIPKSILDENDGNQDACDLCYCYVCDKPAKDCQRWSSTAFSTMYHNHCHASDKGPHATQWQEQRQLYKEERFLRITNFEKMACHHDLIRAFSPTDALAAPYFRSLTKCRSCGWYSKTGTTTTIFGFQPSGPCAFPADWCVACGRVASNKSFQTKPGCTRYKPKPTDIYLGSKTIPFRMKVHDPRKMEIFRDNWSKLEGTSPGWTYDEAAAEEDMFRHRFGTYPSLEIIMGTIPVLEENKIPEDGAYRGWSKGWVKKHRTTDEDDDDASEDFTYEEKDDQNAFDNGPAAVRAHDTDAILVDKNARVLFQELLQFESIGFPPPKEPTKETKSQLVSGDITAKWNKQERCGEFVVRVYFQKISALNGLEMLLGAWFDVFPFPLASLVGSMLATSSFKGTRSIYWHPAPPFKPSAEELEALDKSAEELMKEGVDNFNHCVESSLASLPLKSSLGNSSRLGGVCRSDNSFPGLLQRFFSEKLPAHVKSQGSHATTCWTGRASGITAFHRGMRSIKDSYRIDFRRLSFEYYVRDDDVPIASENLERDRKIIEENTKSNNSLLLHLENLGHNEAPFVEGLNVELLPFQRQTLQWALDRENIPGGVQSFLWGKLPSVEDKKCPELYFSPLLGKLTTGKPRLVRGGMIADEMGLGKTVVSLALILQNPAPLVPDSGSDSVENKSGQSNANDAVGWDVEWQRGEGQNALKASIISRGTLVVCHVSLVSQWIDEARSKLKDPGLVYAYHGQNRKRDAMILAKNSIIVTTYATLAKDATYHAGKAAKNGDSDYCPPCEQIRWWRIICDESHSLKQDTLQTKAVMSLVGDHKWAVSGTPWNTSILDLKNQLKFIGLEHVDPMFNEFQKTVVEPDQRFGGRRGRRAWIGDRKIDHFMFLMRAVVIRHSQNQQYRGTSTTLMSLPPKTERSIMIDFEPCEVVEYAKLEKEALDFYRMFKLTNRKDFSSHYLKLIQALRPLRIACAGGRIPILEGKRGKAKNDADEEGVNGKDDDDEDVEGEDSASDENDEGDDTDEESTKPKKKVAADDEKSVKPKPKKKKKVQVFSESSFQSKFTVLIEELKRIRTEEPDSKSLVFSQYISSLKFLQEELPKHGFQFRTLSGDMSLRQRAEALHAFQHDPPTTIFILSMRAGAVGINLTQANRVFLLEPAMNPSLEAQAIGRVHRLGQTRNVEIVRLLMKDSIDTRICQLVDKKYSRVRSFPKQAGAKKDDEKTEEDEAKKEEDEEKKEEDEDAKMKEEKKDDDDDSDDDHAAPATNAAAGLPPAAAAAAVVVNTAIVGSMRTDKATLMGEEFDFLFGLKE